jgi:hypothetical protein
VCYKYSTLTKGILIPAAHSSCSFHMAREELIHNTPHAPRPAPRPCGCIRLDSATFPYRDTCSMRVIEGGTHPLATTPRLGPVDYRSHASPLLASKHEACSMMKRVQCETDSFRPRSDLRDRMVSIVTAQPRAVCLQTPQRLSLGACDAL